MLRAVLYADDRSLRQSDPLPEVGPHREAGVAYQNLAQRRDAARALAAAGAGSRRAGTSSRRPEFL